MKYPVFILLAALAFAACAKEEAADNGAAGADADSLEAKFRAVGEIMSGGDLNELDKYIAADFVDHQMMPGYPAGLEGLKKMMGDMRKGYPDMKFTMEEVIVDGNQVIGRYRMTGTNTGECMGMPPTNKTIDIQGVDWVRFENGMAVEHWGFAEEMKMMMQLGMMPPMPGMPGDSAAHGGMGADTSMGATGGDTSKGTGA